MRPDIIRLIQNCSVFSNLEESVIQELLSQCEQITLAPNAILFQRGDLPDFLYFIVSGKLSTFLQNNKDIIHVGHAQAGDIMGELGILSGEPRTLTAKAVMPTVLIKMSAKVFLKLCNDYPVILTNCIKPIISRAQHTINFIAGEKICQWDIIFSANKEMSLNTFKEKLSRQFNENESIAFLHAGKDKINENDLNELSKKHRRVIVLMNPDSLQEVEKYLKVADKLYLLAHANELNNINYNVLELFRDRDLHISRDLILLHPENKNPSNTLAWLALAKFKQHHHVSIKRDKDYQRLLRFITGKAVGLVLGGGGAKGWVHVGLIKALQEKNIIIDAIGGTSGGSIVGAILARYHDYDIVFENLKVLTRNLYNLTSWRNLTWPVISLYNSSTGLRSLKNEFQSHQIEDLWIPYFCISSNLSEYREETHKTGLITEKVLASSSLPGALPPTVINGQLHFDGGLLNNLPVDVMRNIVGINGKVIASKLSPNESDKTNYQFPNNLSLSNMIAMKLGLAHRDCRFPPFIDTFIHSLIVGASMKEMQNALAADILIKLDSRAFSMYSLNEIEEKQLVDMGYQEALKQLAEFS